MKIYKGILLLVFCSCILIITTSNSNAANFQRLDTSKPIVENMPSTTKSKAKHNPKVATRRSAILPGWGQAYNKEYWKIPIVYCALSIPTITFIYNNNWYNRTKSAYQLLYKSSQPNATHLDTLNLAKIHPKLQGLSLSSLQKFRNAFRQDRDYSVLWFVVVWGLNVVDATVFGHLKEFNVSDNLSMQIKPSINPINQAKGLSLVFNINKPIIRTAKVR